MKKAVVVLMTLAFASVSQASWVDDFESYADTAALSGPYTQFYAEFPLPLDTTKGYLSDQSIVAGPNANSQQRMWINIPGGPMKATDAAPITFEFMVDIETVGWHTREYIEIRSYAGGAYDQGSLQELIAMGFTSSGVDTTKANYRVLTKTPTPSWGDFTDPAATRAAMAAAEWTKLTAIIKTSTVEFYVNDVPDVTVSRNPAFEYFDSIVLGSGLSTAVTVWFDDLSVVPEPATLALLGLGALGLIRRR